MQDGGQRGGAGPGGQDRQSEITDWVTSNLTKQTVGGMTVYDLSNPKNAG